MLAIRAYLPIFAMAMLLPLLGVGLAPAEAAVYWVSSDTGNDGNAGTAGSPFATIFKALQTANSGDTIQRAMCAVGHFRQSGEARPTNLVLYPGFSA